MGEVRIEQGNAFVVDCISQARKRVVFVSYMLTSLAVVRALWERADAGCEVSVLTLPPDMIRSRDRQAAMDRVRNFHDELHSKGRLEYADLEIGEPRRTSSSQSDVRNGEVIGRKWYALHAKFLVVDDMAIMTSANCGHQFSGKRLERKAVDESQWEVHCLSREPALAEAYVSAYERLREALRHDADESLWRHVRAAVANGQENKALLQEGVNSYRLTDYPLQFIGDRSFADRRDSELLVFPFSARAREYLRQLVENADGRLWLCAETLTDVETLELILRMAATKPGLQVRLLTGPLSTVTETGLKLRVRTQFLPALTALADFEWREVSELHAKMWVTDRAAAVGSVNPNKTNLGFRARAGYWRSSVEAMHVLSGQSGIAAVASAFEELWDKGTSAPSWADVDSYAQAVVGKRVPKRVLEAIRSEVADARVAYYKALSDAVGRHLED